MLSGNAGSEFGVTVKWDGAPAIFAGVHPDTGKFFVSSKSLFNKNAKVNYTAADVDVNHQGGLADKLKTALTYLFAQDWNQRNPTRRSHVHGRCVHHEDRW